MTLMTVSFHLFAPYTVHYDVSSRPPYVSWFCDADTPRRWSRWYSCWLVFCHSYVRIGCWHVQPNCRNCSDVPPAPNVTRYAYHRARGDETGHPTEQPVTVALCGFPYDSKHRATVCGQIAAHCGYRNHKFWCEEKEPAPTQSEPVTREASAPAPTRRQNTHFFFADWISLSYCTYLFVL